MSLIFNRSPPLSEDWQLPALLRWHFEHPRKTSSSNTVCQRPADVTKLSLIPRELEWRWIQGVKFFILIVINWNWISLESYAFAGERLGVGGLQNTDAGFVVEVKCFGYLQEDFSQGSSFNPGVICFFFLSLLSFPLTSLGKTLSFLPRHYISLPLLSPAIFRFSLLHPLWHASPSETLTWTSSPPASLHPPLCLTGASCFPHPSWLFSKLLFFRLRRLKSRFAQRT